jgi:hypothetical protein
MKKQLSVRIDGEVLDRVRDLVYWNAGMSLSGLVESVLEATVNQFDNIPKRTDKNLKAGRKLS